MKKQLIKPFNSIPETRKPEISQIIGNIPEWVSGRLIRTCPGKWEFPKFKLNHLRDGYTLICKFEIRGGKIGKIAYSSRFLRSESYRLGEIEQKPVYPEFGTRSAGTDSSKSVFGKVVASMIPEPTDNCPFIFSSGLCRNPIVTGDIGFMFELDMKTILPLSRVTPPDFGLHGASSHPLTDNETGETYNIGTYILPTARWKILKFPAGCRSSPFKETVKKAKLIATHPCRIKTSPPWLHSFGMSSNYLVWIDQPYLYNVPKFIAGLFHTPCGKEVLDWMPEKKNQFYFYHKRTGKIVTTEILSKDAFFFSHILNCFEEDQHLVIDVFSMPNNRILDNQLIQNLRAGKLVKDSDGPLLVRYVFPLCVDDIKNCPQNLNLNRMETTATAIRFEEKVILEPEVMSGINMDNATWNKKAYGKSLRYIWAGAFAPSAHHNRVVKFDLNTRVTLKWEAATHQYVGDPVFVGRPNSQDEDDGVIILVVINYVESSGNKDFVVFLDARNMKELARAEFDAEIPFAHNSIWQ